LRLLHNSTKNHQLAPQSNNLWCSRILPITKTRTATITIIASSSLVVNLESSPKKCCNSRSHKIKMRIFNHKKILSRILKIRKPLLSSRRTFRSVQKNGIQRSLLGKSNMIVLLPTQALATSMPQTRRSSPKMIQASV